MTTMRPGYTLGSKKTIVKANMNYVRSNHYNYTRSMRLK